MGEPSVSLRRKERYEEEVRPEGEIPALQEKPRSCDESAEALSAEAETQTKKTGKAGYPGRTEKIERPGDGQAAVLAEHSTDGRRFFLCRPGRRGSDAQTTRRREGEAGHDDPMRGTTGGTLRPQTV